MTFWEKIKRNVHRRWRERLARTARQLNSDMHFSLAITFDIDEQKVRYTAPAIDEFRRALIIELLARETDDSVEIIMNEYHGTREAKKGSRVQSLSNPETLASRASCKAKLDK